MVNPLVLLLAPLPSQLALLPFPLIQLLLALLDNLLLKLLNRNSLALPQLSLLQKLLHNKDLVLLQNHLAKYFLLSNNFLVMVPDKYPTKILRWTCLKLTASTGMNMIVSIMTRIIMANKTTSIFSKTSQIRLTMTAILNTNSLLMIPSIGVATRVKIICSHLTKLMNL